MKIIVLKNGMMPQKQYEYDAGYDIYLPEDLTIDVFETKVIPLGLAIEVPVGYAAMLVPRSSTSKKGLVSQTSCIDAGYTGQIHLIITNCSNKSHSFNKGDRLVSLVIYKLYDNNLTLVNSFKNTGSRGNNGLGSTGQ